MTKRIALKARGFDVVIANVGVEADNVDEETAWRVFLKHRNSDVSMIRDGIVVARSFKPEAS